MRRFGWCVFIAFLSTLSSALAAHAQKRVALVIGNSAYQHTAKLANPKNDASDLATILKKHGFQVLEGFDLGKPAMEAKLRDFARALASNEVGLFFYAGHGLHVSGTNYLVPIDAKLEDASGLDFELVRLDLVQRTMERETSTNILFLDACRDNPLARNLARNMGTRTIEIGRGLAQTQGGVGTLISFSTQPGNVALDGTGRNSPFARALVTHLAVPRHDLSAILIDVRNDVMRATHDKQVPWEHSALRGRFYFDPAMAAGNLVPPVQSQSVLPAEERAARDYDLAAKIGTKEAWDAFLAVHPVGFYSDLARAQRVKLAAPSSANPPPNTLTTTPKDAEKGSAPKGLSAAEYMSCCLKGYLRLQGGNYAPEGQSTNSFKSKSDLVSQCNFTLRQSTPAQLLANCKSWTAHANKHRGKGLSF